MSSSDGFGSDDLHDSRNDGESFAVGSLSVSSVSGVDGGINFTFWYFFEYRLRGACDMQASHIGSFSTFRRWGYIHFKTFRGA